ncbi:hypothetical protein EDD18DRAFT_1107507 [Armillaria luteobubalina]|uniref:Uncharacterized protein n=1 Tax=Armillaria luteobubalina TaxID=153913 RepID=A0AA39Q2E1_9AGAR|nr:hypothetical protein EDD18DRAFT_1107507 [Armillaria luteobubalina]
MDSLQSAVVTLLAAVVVAPIFCVYLYRHGLIPGFLHPETDFWILLIGVSLIISLSPLVDCVGDLLSMGSSVHSLSPSWVESIHKISADISKLRTDNDLDVVSHAKLRQAFSHHAEISHLMAYTEKGIYSSNNLSAIDDQVAKLPLTEAAFRKSLECTLVSLHGSFMSIDQCVIEAGVEGCNSCWKASSSVSVDLRAKYALYYIPNHTITVYTKQDALGRPLVTFEEVSIRVIGGTGNQWGTRPELNFLQDARWPQFKPCPAVANGLTIRGPHFSKCPATRGNSQGQTVWYTSKLPEDIALPPVINPALPIGAVYIHRNMLSADVQIWCFDQNSVWKIIPSNNSSRFSHPNPDNSDRFFRLTKEGCPSWVIAATLQKYQTEAKKKRAARIIVNQDD